MDHLREPSAGFMAEELLRRALGAAKMGVWWWDLQTDTAQWSMQLEAIHGLAPGDFGGTAEDYLARVHPDDRAEVRQRLTEAREGKQREIYLRHRIVRPDGQVRWLDSWGAIERDAAGAPIAMLGTSVDSTTQARTTEAMRILAERSATTGRAFFDSLVRSLSEVLGVRFAFVGEALRPGAKRVRAVSVWAGGAAGESFEYDLAGTPCFNVLTEGVCAYPRAVQAQFPDDTMLVEMGVESYLGVPLRSSTGETVGLIVVLDDQPMLEVETASQILRLFAERAGAELERLTIEEELARNAAQLRQAQHLAKMGIWEWDAHTDRTTWSDEMLSIYGITRAEFTGVGSDYSSWTHPEDQPRQQENIGKWLARGREVAQGEGGGVEVACDPVELRIVRRDGSVRWTRGDAVAIIDATGQPVRMLGVLLDITDQRRVKDQLLQAQKLETVGRLAGGIAHDFNNLLTVTLGSADLALPHSQHNPALRRLLEQIQATALRGEELTSQLLSFARKQVLKLELVDLDALVQRTADVLLSRLIGEQVELRLALEGEAHVRGDAAQLEQVLVNLVINARDAMPDGGVVTVSTERQEDAPGLPAANRGYVQWTVLDTGKGLSSDELAHAFEPFFTTKPPGKGTGLGLSTCFGIVTQHGGAIELESQPGQGTAARVWLPVQANPAAADPAPAAQPAAAAPGAEVVLLVEDDPTVRSLAQQVLTEAHYTVHTANDGVEALEVAATLPPLDLLLTDVIMPRMGGRELARLLSERQPGLKVLFMSGYTDAEVAVEELVHAEVRLLRKPYSLAALTLAVRTAIDEG